MSEALNALEARSAKEIIARRTALELKDGMVVNLGIGLPTLVPQYLPADIHVTIQSENGVIGLDKAPEGARHAYVTDASGKRAAVSSGGAFIDSVTSFGLIRGGHVDVTILGSLQVDQEGSLANWMIPGKKTPGAKAAELSAIGIALDGNIHGCKARRAAVHLLGEQNQPCARAKYRHAVRNALSERFEQIQFAEQLAHDGTLAARQNQPVHRLF